MDDDNPLKRPYGMDGLKSRQDVILANMKKTVLGMRQFMKEKKTGNKVVQKALVPFQVVLITNSNPLSFCFTKKLSIQIFLKGWHGHVFDCAALDVQGGQREVWREVLADNPCKPRYVKYSVF